MNSLHKTNKMRSQEQIIQKSRSCPSFSCLLNENCRGTSDFYGSFLLSNSAQIDMKLALFRQKFHIFIAVAAKKRLDNLGSCLSCNQWLLAVFLRHSASFTFRSDLHKLWFVIRNKRQYCGTKTCTFSKLALLNLEVFLD